MIETSKAGIKKTGESKRTSWELALQHILNGYRQRQSYDGISPFEIMLGIKARSSHEPSISTSTTSNEMVARKSEISTALATCAGKSVRYSNPEGEKYRVSLKLNNAFNKVYYRGWSTVTPQMPRALNANVTYRF